MACLTTIIAVAGFFCVLSGTLAHDSGNGICEDFGYGENQASEWGECWPACDGDSQSPINIVTRDVVTESLPPLQGTFYRDRNIPFHFVLSNDNSTVTLRLNDSSYLYLEGGPLEGRYYLDHMRFTWGSNDSMGSEHTIDGKRYPMEGQWVLYSENYSSYEEASKHLYGIMMIAQLYPLVSQENPSMAPIVKALPDVVEPGQVAYPEEPLTYDQLFSGFPVNDYYTYSGSVTTPPCTENVTWLAYPALNGINKDQLEAFGTLQSTDGPLENNFRQLQPLNGRKVVRSDKGSTTLGLSGESCGAAKHGINRRHGTSASQRRGAAVSRRHGAARRHGSARRHH